MPSRSGLLDRVEIVAHAVDAAAGGRDDIMENSLGTQAAPLRGDGRSFFPKSEKMS
jgi:hypothetical protein